MIRKGKKEDIPKVEKIYNAVLTAEEKRDTGVGWKRGIYPTKETIASALNKDQLFVMEENGCVVAAAKINKEQCEEYRSINWQYSTALPEEIMVLHTLAVDPSSKGKGYGKKMVEFYEGYAVDNNCKFLRMDTNIRNTNARWLYGKLGYIEVGTVVSAFNGIENTELVCLEKKL